MAFSKQSVAAAAAMIAVLWTASAVRADEAAPVAWASAIKLSGHIETGVTFNPDRPADGLNFGQLLTDRANQMLLNSAAVTLERDPDPASKTPDWGFKLQAAYGADARYTQAVGEFNRALGGRNQIDLVEAHLDAHLPLLTPGGLEVHAGVIPTLEGVEVIDPTSNFFYSRSYIFSFGTPLKFTGALSQIHLTPVYDLYLGVDTGVNTLAGGAGGANAGRPHFHGGVGVNLKNFTLLATTQIGPEDFRAASPYQPIGLSGKTRVLNDVVAIWKINDAWTSMTDINSIFDSLTQAGGGGLAQYLTVVVSPHMTLGVRAEVWRDDKNAYVAAFPGPHDYINAEGGYAPSRTVVLAAHQATYSELTFGVNYKPQGLPKSLSGLLLRPELRFDALLTKGEAFDTGTKSRQTTVAIDMILPFGG